MKNSKEVIRAVKFTLISISAGIVQALSFTLLNELLRFNYWISYLVSLILSVIWNFTINRKFTFKSAANIKLSMLLVALFYVVFTPVSTYLGQLAETSGINEYIVLAVSMISNLILEYLYTRFVVYRHTCDTLKDK